VVSFDAARMSTRKLLLFGAAGFGLGILLLICGLFATAFVLDGDVRKAYPSPEMHAGVCELASHEPTGSIARPYLNHDFDGDGVADELAVEYFHMEPLVRRSTSGIVYVRSGATKHVLLAHAVVDPNPNRAAWVGDVDRSGTDDVSVRDEGRTFVLGYAKPR